MIRSQQRIVFKSWVDSAESDLRAEPWAALQLAHVNESLRLEQKAIHARQSGAFEIAAELFCQASTAEADIRKVNDQYGYIPASIRLTASIGVTVGGDSANREHLLTEAVTALQVAKRTGRDRVSFR